MNQNEGADTGEVETPQPEPTQELFSLLQTRCGCRRIIGGTPDPPPRLVQVELAPLSMEDAKQKLEKRTFYLVQQGLVDGKRAAFYVEGPDPEQPRIIVPDRVPVSRKLIH